MIQLSVALALVAAMGNAAASVLQRRAAAGAPSVGGHRLSWLAGLVRRSGWLWGAGLLVLSGLAQAGALATGPLAVVQPVMTTELLFTLALGSIAFHRPPGLRVWAAFLGMAAGLAAFLEIAAPGGGLNSVPSDRWILRAVPVAVVMLALALAGMALHGSPRAAVLGTVTAIGFSFTAALMKDTVSLLPQGLGTMLRAWQLYAAAGVALLSFFLLQLTLRAGSLAASQPALTLGDSLLSVILGVTLFDEEITLGWRVLPEAAALGLIVLSSVQLARSPVVSGEEEERW
jgi:drug/metabolite transporter (DMT)-like permease